jgi:hypothetical protein
MNLSLFPRRDTAALAALREGYIELGTRVILMEALLEDTRKRVPYRTEKVRMIDSRSPKYQRARANVIEQLKQAVERGV